MSYASSHTQIYVTYTQIYDNNGQIFFCLHHMKHDSLLSNTPKKTIAYVQLNHMDNNNVLSKHNKKTIVTLQFLDENLSVEYHYISYITKVTSKYQLWPMRFFE